jgi:hypothetical protein
MTESNGHGPDQVTRWQQKLDKEFPNGLVAHFERGTANYFIARVAVTEMAGLDPVVWLPVFSGSEKSFGPWRVLSYEQVHSTPNRAVRVTFDNNGKPMVWSTAVPKEAVRLMARDREKMVAYAPNGGSRVLKGDPDK